MAVRVVCGDTPPAPCAGPLRPPEEDLKHSSQRPLPQYPEVWVGTRGQDPEGLDLELLRFTTPDCWAPSLSRINKSFEDKNQVFFIPF